MSFKCFNLRFRISSCVEGNRPISEIFFGLTLEQKEKKLYKKITFDLAFPGLKVMTRITGLESPR